MPALGRKFDRIGYRLDDYQAVQSTAIQARYLKIASIMHHLEAVAAEARAVYGAQRRTVSASCDRFTIFCP